MQRMGFVKRRGTTSKSKILVKQFDELKVQFLDDMVTTVAVEEIPPELILNWDQTGLNIVPSSSWTMDQRGAKRVELTGLNDKWQITHCSVALSLEHSFPSNWSTKGRLPDATLATSFQGTGT